MRNKKPQGARQSASSQAGSRWTVVDLFSGAGGTSAGFARHGSFQIIGAADLEIGRPSEAPGSLECNRTYKANIGIEPIRADLSKITPGQLRKAIKGRQPSWDGNVHVLLTCAPCTGFTRMKAKNHRRDDPKNSLVYRSVRFVKEFQPRVFIMENTRELITGRFTSHHQRLVLALRRLGYSVSAKVYEFHRIGLPQHRERAVLIAVRRGYKLHDLEELWAGFKVRPAATTVRRAIAKLPRLRAGQTDRKDPLHLSPKFGERRSYERLRAIPHDGGSWTSLTRNRKTKRLLIPSMKRKVKERNLGSHCDVYGRLWWDRPAVTIKRECSHQGNGRYSHPEQNRLLTVREMATLQGFPRDYVFEAEATRKLYGHIGDAVPPLISYQLAKIAEWVLTRQRPDLIDVILPQTHLRPADIVRDTSAAPKCDRAA